MYNHRASIFDFEIDWFARQGSQCLICYEYNTFMHILFLQTRFYYYQHQCSLLSNKHFLLKFFHGPYIWSHLKLFTRTKKNIIYYLRCSELDSSLISVCGTYFEMLWVYSLFCDLRSILTLLSEPELRSPVCKPCTFQTIN